MNIFTQFCNKNNIEETILCSHFKINFFIQLHVRTMGVEATSAYISGKLSLIHFILQELGVYFKLLFMLVFLLSLFCSLCFKSNNMFSFV